VGKIVVFSVLVGSVAWAVATYVPGVAPSSAGLVFADFHTSAEPHPSVNGQRFDAPTSSQIDASFNTAGSTLDGTSGAGASANRVYIYDQGWDGAATATRGNANFAMLVWEFPTAVDFVRIFPMQDHLGEAVEFVVQDVAEWSVWGSNDGDAWTLLSDPLAAVGTFPNQTYTYFGLEPTTVYRSGTTEFGDINSYTRDYDLPTPYKWIGLRTSTISQDFRSALYPFGDADPEIDAVAGRPAQEEPPGPGCTYTQGYWKNHVVNKKGQNLWPVTSLSLGNPGTAYSQAQLVKIFKKSPSGNGLIQLAHQLIAAKLNVAENGGAPASVLADISAADNLIGALVVPPIGANPPNYLAPSKTSALTHALDLYNMGERGVPHCD
jgi:hypothetical protein